MTFDAEMGAHGVVEMSVSKYCAGYTLRCTASIEALRPGVCLAGHVDSSDGGAVFDNLAAGERVRFDLRTSFWHSTMFTLHLRTTPEMPEGTVLRVSMDVDS